MIPMFQSPFPAAGELLSEERETHRVVLWGNFTYINCYEGKFNFKNELFVQ
jgi:hypothetical protein